MADHPLRPICTAWTKLIRLAWEHKKKKFGDDASEAMQFFCGPYDFLYGLRNSSAPRGFAYTGEDGDLPKPTFAMTVNKVAELVALYGPALYHRNPVRQVNPRKLPTIPVELFGDPNDPNIQMQYQQIMAQTVQQQKTDGARATLMQQYLNWSPGALDLKTESRWAITEALIKGLGVMWTEPYKPAGGQTKMIGSFYRTVDDLVIDPDMESLRDAQWIAERCVHPYWHVEEEYGLPPDSLKEKGTLESFGRQAEVGAITDGDYMRKRGQTNDLMVYWKIYSKMGMGGRLVGVESSLKQPLEAYGKFCYLVVAEGIPYPLNLPDEMLPTMDDAELSKRVEWPTPFWADDSWPFTGVYFTSVPREIWPMSIVKPAMGELKFLNWAYSFLAGKVRTACRDFIAIAKSAGEDVKSQIQNGQDYTIIEVEALHGSIDKVVSFLQHPGFNPEIYKIMQGVEENFEKRTGLTELMYGMSNTQLRSAEEANVKSGQMSVRPDDMANKVEDAMSELAAKEALACRWHLQPPDVMPVMGPVGAQFWQQLVSVSDPAEIIHQLEYRIEAGSAKKPNKARDAGNMSTAMTNLFTPLFQYAMQTGNVGPVNNLLTAWAKSIDLEASGFLLIPPAAPPPMPGHPGPGGPPPHGGPPPGPTGGHPPMPLGNSPQPQPRQGAAA